MLVSVALTVALAAPPADLPPGAVDQLGSPALRHTSYVAAVAFSPDSKRLATGSNTNWTGGTADIKVWDVASGAAILSAPHETGGLAWLPDGRRLAAAGGGRLTVWEVATGRTLLRVKPAGGRWTAGVAASPDGRTLATVHTVPARVVLWDVATGQQVRELLPPGEDDPRYSRREGCVVAFSPDGKTVAAGVSQLGTVVWDATTGEVRRTVPGAYSSPQYEAALSFAADGTLAVRKQEGVALIDPATGADRGAVGHSYRGEGTPSRFALSADRKRLAMAWVSGLKVWDVVADRELRTFDYPGGGWPGGVALSPDGELLAWGGYGNAALLWEVKTGRRLHPGGHDGYIGLVGFGAAGEVYTRDATGLRVWDIGPSGKRRGEPIKTGKDVVAVSPDGHAAVSGGYTTYHTGQLIDLRTGETKGKLDVAERGYITAVTFHPDGRRLVTVDGGQTLSLWDEVSGKRLRKFEGHNDPVDAVAITPDGKQMATSGTPRMHMRAPPKGYVEDTGIRVWDMDTGAEVRQIKGRAGCLAFSPDGKLLAAGNFSAFGADPPLRLLDAATGAEVRQLQTPKYYSPHRIAFTPDGRTLVSVGRDKAVRLWDVTTGTERRRFDGHAGEVYPLVVSPDGRRLLTAGGDGLAYVWDVYAPDRPPPADLAPAVEGLADLDAAAAFRAVRELAAAGDRAVPLLTVAGGPRAVEALEVIGTPAARVALGKLAGPDAVASAARLARRAVVRWVPPVAEPPADAERLLSGPPKVTTRLSAKAVLGADHGYLIPATNALAAVAYGSGLPLKVIDLPSGRERRVIPPQPQWTVHEASLSPDAARLAVIAGHDGANGTLYVHDVAAGTLLWRMPGVMTTSIYGLAWSPAGDRLAVSGREPASVRVWDAATGREIRSWPNPKDGYQFMNFSADGQSVTVRGVRGQQVEVRVLDVTSGTVVQPPLGGGPPRAADCGTGLTADGRTSLSGTRLAERVSGKVRADLTGTHPERADVWYAALTADGRTAVTADKHGALLMWDLAGATAAPAAADYDPLWQLLGGADAGLAYRAGWRLTAGGDAAVAEIAHRLPPVPTDPAAHVAELLAALEAPTVAARQAATGRLELLGPLAAPALRQTPARPPGEWTDRVRHLLAQAERPTPTREVVRAVRVVEVLERMGTPAARAALGRYAAGPAGHVLTAEAAASLKRLGG